MTTEDKYKDALLNSYLELARETAPLKDIAYARIILWCLFIEKKSMNLREIIDAAAKLIGVFNLPQESIEHGLNLLSIRKMTFPDKNDPKKWYILPALIDKLDAEVIYSEKSTNEILDKRFPKTIEKNTLISWFNELNEKYFSSNSITLISLYYSGKPLISNLSEIIEPLITKYRLEKYREELIQGYNEFLQIPDGIEGQRILNLVRSLLSTKIVSAEISPDILNIDKYKNSIVLLDTNILLYLNVSKGDDLRKTLDIFAKIVGTLGISLKVAEFTKDEYEKVVARERKNSLEIWDKYSLEIIEGMGRKDDFTQSLLQSGCRTRSDVMRFFDEGLKFPQTLGSLKIDLIKNSDLGSTSFNRNNKSDSELFETIRNITEEFRGSKKPEEAAIHDVRLMKLVKKMRKEGNCYVLTMDIPMEALSIREVNEKEESEWRSLRTITNVLALNGAGPNFDPSDLFPLYKTFVDMEAIKGAGQYDEDDLLILAEKTERINELSKTQAVSLLNKIHRAKNSHNDRAAVFDITLELERALRKKDFKGDVAIKEKDSLVQSLQRKVTGLVFQLKAKEVREAWAWFILRLVVALFVSYFLFTFLKLDLLKDIIQNDHHDIIEIIVRVFAPIAYIVSNFVHTLARVKEIKDDDN